MDKSYIAPQLSITETIMSGVYLLFYTLFCLIAIGLSALIGNLFSPTFPRQGKIVNVLVMLGSLLVIAALVAGIVLVKNKVLL